MVNDINLGRQNLKTVGQFFLRALVVMRGSLGDLIMMVEPT